MTKPGDIIMLVPESWPSPGYDAGYMGKIEIDGRKIDPSDVHRVEKLFPPSWFNGRRMEISEVRTHMGSTIYVVEQKITITLELKLLNSEFEVVDESG